MSEFKMQHKWLKLYTYSTWRQIPKRIVQILKKSHNCFVKHDTSRFISLLWRYKYIFMRSPKKTWKLKEAYYFVSKIWLQCTLPCEVFWNSKISLAFAQKLTFKDIMFCPFLRSLDSWQVKVFKSFIESAFWV